MTTLRAQALSLLFAAVGPMSVQGLKAANPRVSIQNRSKQPWTVEVGGTREEIKGSFLTFKMNQALGGKSATYAKKFGDEVVLNAGATLFIEWDAKGSAKQILHPGMSEPGVDYIALSITDSRRPKKHPGESMSFILGSNDQLSLDDYGYPDIKTQMLKTIEFDMLNGIILKADSYDAPAETPFSSATKSSH